MEKEIVKKNTILLVEHGSHAYGTNTPESDLDLRGIAVPPKEYFLGFLNVFKQKQDHGEIDETVFDVRKFFTLAADCNPNVLEILFVDPSNIKVCDKQGQKLIDNRDLFLSAKAKFTFTGYAIAQLKRIKTHKKWLDNPPTHAPTRDEFGLPALIKLPHDQLEAVMSQIRKEVDSWEIPTDFFTEDQKIWLREQMTIYFGRFAEAEELVKWRAGAVLLGLDDNFIELIQKEKRYQAAKKEWEQYNEWLKNRNPVRAELEKKFGYDTKHGAHLVRLMRMCEELFTQGKLNVRRPDAAELLAIRKHGIMSYEQIVEYGESMQLKLDQMYKAGQYKIPKQPNRNKLDEICIEIVTRHLGLLESEGSVFLQAYQTMDDFYQHTKEWWNDVPV